MEAIRIVLAAASSMLLVMMMMMIISSASVELTEEAPSPSPSSTPTAAASAPLHRSGFLFTMQFYIGDTKVSGIADTGSDLIWTNNSQLLDADPDPKKCPASNDNDDGITSPSSCNGLCTFDHKYSGGTIIVRGVMGKAKLTFGGGGSAATATSSGGVVNYDDLTIGSALIFGCHRHHLSSSDDVLNTGEENKACKSYARGGIVGLNRDHLSLVTQLHLDNFSYCLPHDMTTTGEIKFNDSTAISSFGAVTTTTMMKLDRVDMRRYYVVGLKLLRMGKTILMKDVQAAADDDDICSSQLISDEGAGALAMIIDSGTPFTVLPKYLFNALKEHVEEELKEKKQLKVVDYEDGFSCYEGTFKTALLDSIKLLFCSGGMEIPPENYFIQKEKTTDGGGKDPYFCLAFITTEEKKSIVLGAYQQQDMHMLFDIKQNTLSFAKRRACGGGGGQSQAQEENHAAM